MKYDEENFKKKLSPEDAVRILKEGGMLVTLEQAKEILFFLRKIANIAVSNHLRAEK